MKINYGALIRLLLLSFTISILLQAAGVHGLITVLICVFLGAAYPESTLVPDTKDNSHE